MLRLPPHTSIVIALHLLHSIGSRQTTTSTILVEDAWPHQHQHNTLINLLLSLSLSLWWSVGAKTRAPKPTPLPRGTGQLEHSHLQPHLHCYLHSYSYHQTCLWMHQDVMDHGQPAPVGGRYLQRNWHSGNTSFLSLLLLSSSQEILQCSSCIRHTINKAGCISHPPGCIGIANSYWRALCSLSCNCCWW